MMEEEKRLNEDESDASTNQIEQGTEVNESCSRPLEELEKSEKLATEEMNRRPEFTGSRQVDQRKQRSQMFTPRLHTQKP